MLLVLGNGPSLNKYPFYEWDVPTVGMNVAYRYWEEINWYPTYYCCMDKNTTKQHHKGIYNMIKNREKFGIKKFFLRKLICDYYPELKKCPDIVFEEKMSSKALGFSSYKRKTTGSWAVRFGIYLGYKTIYLLGIDCNYVPLHTTKKIQNNLDKDQKLQMNFQEHPNYFFNSYQKKGDWFHIPSKPNKDLHVEGFKVLMNELKKLNEKRVDEKKLRVINCNKDSKLYTMKVLPYSSHLTQIQPFLEKDEMFPEKN